MKRRTLKLPVVLLLLTLGGCAAGRPVYLALTHRIIKVQSESMLPTLKPGDMAAVDEQFYAERPVGRFDIVTYKLAPENFSDDMMSLDVDGAYVGRVLGLGGETLETKGGVVYVNGRALEEPFATVPFVEERPFGPVEVPAGEVFLMGDNRPNSLDGRYWARPTLKRQNILGKVVQILPQ